MSVLSSQVWDHPVRVFPARASVHVGAKSQLSGILHESLEQIRLECGRFSGYERGSKLRHQAFQNIQTHLRGFLSHVNDVSEHLQIELLIFAIRGIKLPESRRLNAEIEQTIDRLLAKRVQLLQAASYQVDTFDKAVIRAQVKQDLKHAHGHAYQRPLRDLLKRLPKDAHSAQKPLYPIGSFLDISSALNPLGQPTVVGLEHAFCMPVKRHGSVGFHETAAYVQRSLESNHYDSDKVAYLRDALKQGADWSQRFHDIARLSTKKQIKESQNLVQDICRYLSNPHDLANRSVLLWGYDQNEPYLIELTSMKNAQGLASFIIRMHGQGTMAHHYHRADEAHVSRMSIEWHVDDIQAFNAALQACLCDKIVHVDNAVGAMYGAFTRELGGVYARSSYELEEEMHTQDQQLHVLLSFVLAQPDMPQDVSQKFKEYWKQFLQKSFSNETNDVLEHARSSRWAQPAVSALPDASLEYLWHTIQESIG